MKKDLPVIIQGGMGVAVSDWRLANAVSSQGQLGVVSGVALGALLARRLEVGDPGEHMRRALAAFPFKDAAQRILDRYFIEGGKDPDTRFAVKPMAKMHTSRKVEELIVAGCFTEVYLAKEGHNNPVGVNFLEKIQVTTLPSLYGVMLAGVDYVLMGAGIPRYIPGILDRLAGGFDVELKVDVKGLTDDGDPFIRFSPKDFARELVSKLPRPDFLAIVSSHVLARMLATKSNGEVNGFIVELPVAGGHNAPPRKKGEFNEDGEPIYGGRDVPDLVAIACVQLACRSEPHLHTATNPVSRGRSKTQSSINRDANRLMCTRMRSLHRPASHSRCCSLTIRCRMNVCTRNATEYVTSVICATPTSVRMHRLDGDALLSRSMITSRRAETSLIPWDGSACATR